jgi:tetratricopeptide (TPR) repeat protein
MQCGLAFPMHPTSRRGIAFLLAVMIWLVAAPVGAQDNTKEQARKHFIAAQALEEAGNYEAAAAEYLNAYKYFPEPEFFYNAGRAYELHGDYQRAVTNYQKYIVSAPDGRAADVARSAVSRLKPKLEASHKAQAENDTTDEGEESEQALTDDQEKETPEGTTPEGNGSPGGVTSGESTSGQELVDEGVSISVTDDEQATRRSGRPLKFSGLAAAGVGLLTTAVGIKYAMDVGRLSNEIAGTRDQWTSEDLVKFDKGERASTRSFIFTGVGMAALVAGGALYYLGMRQDEGGTKERIGWAPSVSSRTVGVVVLRRF